MRLTQLVETMHDIFKVRGSNPGHQGKKILYNHITNNFFCGVRGSNPDLAYIMDCSYQLS